MKIKDNRRADAHAASAKKSKEKGARERASKSGGGEPSSFRAVLAKKEKAGEGAQHPRATQETRGEAREDRMAAMERSALDTDAREARAIDVQDARESLGHRERMGDARHDDRLEHRDRHQQDQDLRQAGRRSEASQARPGDEGQLPNFARAPAAPERRETSPAREGESLAIMEGAAEQGASLTASEDVAPTSSPEEAARREVAQIADAIVDACHVGKDQHARKVMLLDITLPGRGKIRVRLRREGNGIAVRMRAEDGATREALRARSGNIRREASEQGVSLSRIDIV